MLLRVFCPKIQLLIVLLEVESNRDLSKRLLLLQLQRVLSGVSRI